MLIKDLQGEIYLWVCGGGWVVSLLPSTHAKSQGH